MTEPTALRIMIVDDHPVVRAGMVAILSEAAGLKVVAECGDGAQALSLAASVRPDVILMDLRMPVMDGAEATQRLTRTSDAPAVVILTTFDGDDDIVRAVEAGARGYLLKDSLPEVVVGAVRAAARGETVLAPRAAERLARASAAAGTEGSDAVDLTPRERQVLEAVALGRANAEIGQDLFIAESTVKTHLLRVFQKLGVNDRTAAVTTAYRLGLLTAPWAAPERREPLGRRHHPEAHR